MIEPKTSVSSSDPAPSYVVKTLGCKANLYDSQLIEAELRKRGWRPFEKATAEPGEGQGETGAQSGPLLCIVNSCTVTDEADRQSRRLASRLSRENPASRVVVTGCGAEVDPERLARSKGIHYVIGNQDKPRMIDLILAKLETSRSASASLAHPESDNPAQSHGEVLGSVLEYGELISRHPMDREWPAPAESFFTPPVHLDGHSGKTRAFLKIQEGCNAFCTYCIIPYGRGPSRSLRPGDVIAQAQELVAQGVKEIIVTGTNIGDYGVDWGLDPVQALEELFELLLKETGLERLRVGSLDPSEITDGLLALMERDPRFCPHFHVSLQATESKILRLMKRKYGIEQVRSRLERIANLPAAGGGAFIGMDLITGFPGETDSDFESGFAELSRLPWSRLHVFPYSERKGTPATRLPGAVSPNVRAERARRLGELSLARVQAHAQRALSECEASGVPLRGILLEKPTSRAPQGVDELALPELPGGERWLWANGYTPNYLRVFIPLPESQALELRNQIVDAVPELVLMDRAQGDVALKARLVPRLP